MTDREQQELLSEVLTQAEAKRKPKQLAIGGAFVVALSSAVVAMFQSSESAVESLGKTSEAAVSRLEDKLDKVVASLADVRLEVAGIKPMMVVAENLRLRLEAHEALPGHPASIARLEAMEREVARLTREIERHRDGNGK